MQIDTEDETFSFFIVCLDLHLFATSLHFSLVT